MSEAADELLPEDALESSRMLDTNTPEGFKKYILVDRDLSSYTIRHRIYSIHDADKIREFIK